MLANIKEYLDLIITIIGSLAIILGLLAKLFKSEKLKKVAETINFYQTKAEVYVKQAEKLFELQTGKEKLAWVVKQIQIEAEKKGVEFDYDEVVSIIETIIDITKHVNIPK